MRFDDRKTLFFSVLRVHGIVVFADAVDVSDVEWDGGVASSLIVVAYTKSFTNERSTAQIKASGSQGRADARER